MSIALPTQPAVILPNSVPAARERAAAGLFAWPQVWIALLFRTLAFAGVQALVALLFVALGRSDAWHAAAAWWPVAAIVAGLLTFWLLYRLAGREGLRYVDLLNASRATVRGDLLWLLVLTLLSGPLVYLPMQWVAGALWGDPQAGSRLMFQPLPVWLALALLVLLPLSIALVELPTYVGYAMPRIEALSGSAWLAVGMASFFLALQHVTLPLLFDWRFAVWRLLMFVPFALMIGIAVRLRPTLLPYLMVGHFLVDVSTGYMVYFVSTGGVF